MRSRLRIAIGTAIVAVAVLTAPAQPAEAARPCVTKSEWRALERKVQNSPRTTRADVKRIVGSRGTRIDLGPFSEAYRIRACKKWTTGSGITYFMSHPKDSPRRLLGVTGTFTPRAVSA